MNYPFNNNNHQQNDIYRTNQGCPNTQNACGSVPHNTNPAMGNAYTNPHYDFNNQRIGIQNHPNVYPPQPTSNCHVPANCHVCQDQLRLSYTHPPVAVEYNYIPVNQGLQAPTAAYYNPNMVNPQYAMPCCHPQIQNSQLQTKMAENTYAQKNKKKSGPLFTIFMMLFLIISVALFMEWSSTESSKKPSSSGTESNTYY